MGLEAEEGEEDGDLQAGTTARADKAPREQRDLRGAATPPPTNS